MPIGGILSGFIGAIEGGVIGHIVGEQTGEISRALEQIGVTVPRLIGVPVSHGVGITLVITLSMC